MKIGMGAIIGLVGGLLAVVGVFLPWFSVTSGGQTLSWSGYDLGAAAVQYPQLAWLAIFPLGILAFGILGLILALIPKKVTGILAMLCGILVLVFSFIPLLIFLLISTIGGGMGIGTPLSFIGGIILMVGGIMAYRDAKKAMTGMPMGAMPSPPPPA